MVSDAYSVAACGFAWPARSPSRPDYDEPLLQLGSTSMNDRFSRSVICGWVAIPCAVLLIISCQPRQASVSGPMGKVKSTARIGTEGMTLDQVQAEVENF